MKHPPTARGLRHTPRAVKPIPQPCCLPETLYFYACQLNNSLTIFGILAILPFAELYGEPTTTAVRTPGHTCST